MITKNILLKKLNKIHNKKYDYSLLEIINHSTKIKIICPEHGIFEQLIGNHLSGNGCPICNSVKISKDEYFNRCKKKHNDYYDYSLSEYIGTSKKIKIICPEHGIFEQRADNHMNGQRCIYCSNKKWSTSKFIKLSNEIHNKKYDYSLSEYKNAHTKIKIICSTHGIFEQIPWNHLNKAGCPYCSENRTNLEIFKSKSNWKHNNFYNYSLITEYISSETKVEIICPKHGIFEQSLRNHQHGQGCPICTESKGEKIIRLLFELNRINFIQYKKFKSDKYKTTFEFDFYLQDHNILIEYDGIQHFESVEYFGGEDSLTKCQIRDGIKNKYCKENDIKLIRIRYDEIDNIDSIFRNDFQIYS